MSSSDQVKRHNFLVRYGALLLVMPLLTHCSYFKKALRSRQTVEEPTESREEEQLSSSRRPLPERGRKVVSSQQYKLLLQKNQKLLEENRRLKRQKLILSKWAVEHPGYNEEVLLGKVENNEEPKQAMVEIGDGPAPGAKWGGMGMETASDPSPQSGPEGVISDVERPGAKGGEMVNGKGQSAKLQSAPQVDDAFLGREGVEGEIYALNRGIQYWKKSNFTKSMRIFQLLEKSKNTQIAVRAKYNIGQLLYDQKEYDLGLQVFEEIVTRYAFSYSSIKALKKLIHCADKLKLQKKKKQYQRLLDKFLSPS